MLLLLIIYFTLFVLCVNIELKIDLLWDYSSSVIADDTGPRRQSSSTLMMSDRRTDQSEEGPKAFNAVGGCRFQS